MHYYSETARRLQQKIFFFLCGLLGKRQRLYGDKTDPFLIYNERTRWERKNGPAVRIDDEAVMAGGNAAFKLPPRGGLS
jgi:hypothetical protein